MNDDEKKVTKTHPNSTRLNAYIAKKVAEAEAKMVELQTKQKRPSGKKIKDEIMGGVAVNFFEFTKSHLEAIEKAGHINMAKRIKSIQEKLQTYLALEPGSRLEEVRDMYVFSAYAGGSGSNMYPNCLAMPRSKRPRSMPGLLMRNWITRWEFLTKRRKL